MSKGQTFRDFRSPIYLSLSCLFPRVFYLWVPLPRDIDSAQPGGLLLQAATLLVCPVLMVHGLFPKPLPLVLMTDVHPSVQPAHFLGASLVSQGTEALSHLQGTP